MLVVRSLLFTSFLFVTALMGGFAVLVTFWGPDRLHWWLTLSWCRLSVWAGEFFCNMYVVVEGTENIPDEPSVLMIKHTTALETYWQVTAFPQATWVIKREILWIPLFGWAVALLLDPIAINRSSGRRAVMQVIQKGKAKLNEGIWVTVFPEGTRMPPGETR